MSQAVAELKMVSKFQHEFSERTEEKTSLRLSGNLDAETVASVWNETTGELNTLKTRLLVLDVSGVEQCDMTGIGLILELKNLQESSGGKFQINGLRPAYQNLFDLVCQRGNRKVSVQPAARLSELETIGRNVDGFFKDLYDQIVFIGEVIVQVGRALMTPRSIRWKDVFLFIEKSGVDAVPIIAMVGFLVGMIIAFQGVIPLRQMGSDIFVAAIVAFAILRELGPLITAIILAGRTGSAIAAEIGTMKINEEVNALTTMGLEPVRFLVVSRVLGILFLAPLLTIVSDFFGMLGGAVVFTLIGHPLTTYVNQITQAVTLHDIWGGLFKAFPFGLAIACVGCLRGLQTKTGASAVGDSTTSSVVTGIVLVIILDGLISTLYYFLGI
jgi:phospholipid/cholesterol/gamma-HCH transport system permease protein